MIPFRLYMRGNCVHCKNAMQWFQEQGIPLQMIDVNADPILQAGIRYWPQFVFAKEEDRAKVPGDTVPLLLYFSAENGGQFVVGFNLVEYARLAEHYRKSIGAGAFSVAGTESVNPEPTAPVVEPSPAAEGIT